MTAREARGIADKNNTIKDSPEYKEIIEKISTLAHSGEYELKQKGLSKNVERELLRNNFKIHEGILATPSEREVIIYW